MNQKEVDIKNKWNHYGMKKESGVNGQMLREQTTAATVNKWLTEVPIKKIIRMLKHVLTDQVQISVEEITVDTEHDGMMMGEDINIQGLIEGQLEILNQTLQYLRSNPQNLWHMDRTKVKKEIIKVAKVLSWQIKWHIR